MPLRVLFAAVAAAALFSSSPAHAQFNPETKTPYLWRVVLKAQGHPLLSPTFRAQLRRDLEAALQPDLGPLGVVEVVDLADIERDQWEPLWQQFDDKGFAALDASRDLSGTKTHFLKIEYKDGLYHLESRQHDGFTGLSSGYSGYAAPVVRKQSTRAPEMVGRIAGLMLDRDFGLDGTVEPIIGNTREVKVIVRGGQLGPLTRFVQKDDIFAVSEVTETKRPAPPPPRTATGKVIQQPGAAPPPGLVSKPRSGCLLRVTEVGPDGVLRCALLATKPLEPRPANVAGYRCMRLGTVTAPLTVRIVSSTTATAAKTSDLVTLRANDKGFESPENPGTLLTPKAGQFLSPQPLNNVAFISVTLGPTQKKQFPVPILGTETVSLLVEVNPKDEEKAAYEKELAATLAQVEDARNALSICFDAIIKFSDKNKRKEAMDRAKGGYQASTAVATNVGEELKRLRENQDKSPRSARDLKRIELLLAALQESNKQLEGYIVKLEDSLKQESDPTRNAKSTLSEELQDRIKLHLSRGEVDQALSAYDQLAAALPDNAEVKARRDKLKADWAPKSDGHARARDYILKTFANLANLPDYKDSQKTLEDAIKVCKDNSDQYTLRRLLVIFNQTATKLTDLAANLDSNSEADRKLLDDAQKARDFFEARENDVREYLKGVTG
jgi:hypothetical protein